MALSMHGAETILRQEMQRLKQNQPGFSFYTLGGDIIFPVYPTSGGIASTFIAYLCCDTTTGKRAKSFEVPQWRSQPSSVYEQEVIDALNQVLVGFSVNAPLLSDLLTGLGSPIGSSDRGFGMGVDTSLVTDLKNVVRMYGRHTPHCQTGIPCQCGFDATMKRLGLM